MAVYYNDKNVLTYSYIIDNKQVDEDVDYLKDFVYYVRKNGLYWVDANNVYRLYNTKTKIYINNIDIINVTRLIVINKDTSIFVTRDKYYIYHKNLIRYSNDVQPDFDMYRFNFIRNGNKLFNLYTFSETLFDEIPTDCKYYIQLNNRNFINPHNYINNEDKQLVGNFIIDSEMLKDVIYKIENLYYVVKDEFCAIYVDIPLDNVQQIEVIGEQVMLYYKNEQKIYHQGILYTVSNSSRLRNSRN